MSKRIGFKGIMMLVSVFIVLEVLVLIAYPAMNTHTDTITHARALIGFWKSTRVS